MGFDNKEKSKFRLSETFNNKDGKTSGSGFIGVIFGLISGAAFITGIVGWWMGIEGSMELFDMILKFAGISALLLGARKITSGFKKDEG